MNDYLLFELETPENDERSIYLTGPFNGWNSRSDRYKLEKHEDGKYRYKLPVKGLPDDIEFKFTKGGWENVEIDEQGNICGNRKAKITDKKITVFVPKWRNNWAPFKSGFFPVVDLISENFEIPQLNKTRKVWALLPYDYDRSQKRYPVLYLQDAQNLFNEGGQYGNWEIDKKLSILAEYGRGDIIIVAVEHGNEDRIKEYVFENNPLVERGDGKKYIRFVTDTLKPYIDKHYRTKPEREFTGIGGSSLGALISIYGGFLYPEVYSKLMIFSPSLWAVPNIKFPMIKFFNPFKTKMYIYGGEKEGSQMVERIHQFVDKMAKYDQDNTELEFKVSINPNGHHSEYYWSQEFPKAIEWLYFDSLKDPADIAKEHSAAG